MQKFWSSFTLVLFLTAGSAFSLHRYARSGKIYNSPSALGASVLSDKPLYDSKLMPSITEADIREISKELNITYDMNDDEEINRWRLSPAFFEKFGFNNYSSERYTRTIQDVKTEFYGNYRVPILPQYKTFISDFLSVVFMQSVDSKYEYDALQAFGLCTQYYTIMKGYALQDEIDVIFNQLMTALKFDPVMLREDAKRVLQLIKESTLSEDEFLAQTEGEIAKIFNNVRANRFFKYTEAWGVGLCRMMELRGLEVNEERMERWSASLKGHVNQRRISQSWSEFCSDQLRMQGVELMQKQLLIREKKRAAERMERQSSIIEDKKKSLKQLNSLLDYRRKELIIKSMEMKKRLEPEEYQRIIEEMERNNIPIPDNKLPTVIDTD